MKRWFGDYFKALRMARTLSLAEMRANEHQQLASCSQRRLKRNHRRLGQLQSELDQLGESWRGKLGAFERRMRSINAAAAEDVEEANRIQEQYEKTVEGLRSELQVLRDVTVPGLVQSNKMMLSELDKYTAINVRQQVGASPNVGVE
jgi:uncharacterized protein YukE